MRCPSCERKDKQVFIGRIRLLESIVRVYQCRKCKMIELKKGEA